MSDLWQEFQDEFLVKMNSADFHTLLDRKLAAPLKKGSNSIKVSRHSIIAAQKSSLLQQRFEAISATLMVPLHSTPTQSPSTSQPPSPRPQPPSNSGSAASGFFLTETAEQSSDRDRDHSPDPTTHHADVAPPSPYDASGKKALEVSQFPPPKGARSGGSSSTAAGKSFLQSSVDAAIRAASWEKYKPLGPQFVSLQSLLDRLASSAEEQEAFLADVAASVRARRRRAGSQSTDAVRANAAATADGTFEPAARLLRIREMAELREARLQGAHERVEQKVAEEVRAKEELVLIKLMQEQDTREQEIRNEMWRKWLPLLPHVAFLANLKTQFKRNKDLYYVAEHKKVLANKIVNMWKFKKAPDKGQQYRKAVLRLRGFIANKTAQWKTNQKNRSVDTIKEFLRDHKRANLPIVVANFVKGVKTWQRWWRVYETATANRIKALLIIWEDAEAEYVAEREEALYAEAEKKKKLEQEFDLDRLVNKAKDVPSYARGRSVAAVTAPPPPPPATGSSSFKSPNVANRTLKQQGGVHHAAASTTRSRQIKYDAKGKLNKAQTSLIIDLRLQKDLQALRERKPTWYLKKDMLKRKLSLLRSIYKQKSPGYLELLSQDGPAAQKVNSIRDVKLLLEGKLTEKTVVEEVSMYRKTRKFPASSKCIKVFSMISREMMKDWIREAYMEQEQMIMARNQVLIDAMGAAARGGKDNNSSPRPPERVEKVGEGT